MYLYIHIHIQYSAHTTTLHTPYICMYLLYAVHMFHLVHTYEGTYILRLDLRMPVGRPIRHQPERANTRGNGVNNLANDPPSLPSDLDTRTRDEV